MAYLPPKSGMEYNFMARSEEIIRIQLTSWQYRKHKTNWSNILMVKREASACQKCSEKRFISEDQFYTTDLNGEWFKTFVMFQYSSGFGPVQNQFSFLVRICSSGSISVLQKIKLFSNSSETIDGAVFKTIGRASCWLLKSTICQHQKFSTGPVFIHYNTEGW